MFYLKINIYLIIFKTYFFVIWWPDKFGDLKFKQNKHFLDMLI